MKQGSAKMNNFQLKVQEEGWVWTQDLLRQRENESDRERGKKSRSETDTYREWGMEDWEGVSVIMATRCAPSPPLERAPLTLTSTDYLTHTPPHTQYIHEPVCLKETISDWSHTCACTHPHKHTHTHTRHLLSLTPDKQKKGKVILQDISL